LQLSREEQIQGQLSLPADLQAVEARLAKVVSFNDSVLRDLSTLLCTSLNPPLKVAAINDPKNPGLSNLCLGLAAAPAGTPLLGAHLDEDMLTITYYDEPFLEVLDPTSQEWRVVEVFENLPVVNVGERFQEASNDRFHAPLHRVVQSPNEINLIMYDLNEGAE
jgi:isopenicillin N synthase-like dioxygenase